MSCLFQRGMRRIELLLGVAICVLAGSATLAAEDLPKADAILDRHVKATGGKEAHLKIKSRTLGGTLSVSIGEHQFEAKLTVHAQAPNKWQLELSGDQLGKMVKASDGKHAWEISDHMGTRLLEGGERQQLMEQAQFHGNVHWRKLYKAVETVGMTDVNGQPAYEVRVTPQEGNAYSQFYDKKSGRLVKYVRSIESPHLGELTVEAYLSDYIEFDGVWVATEMKQKLKGIPDVGEGIQSWSYGEVLNNSDIPDDAFKMPKDLK